jgi:4-aminobutyrate aminotransferase/(S)-3-amino-2-methylpropionate transaminase
LPGIAAWTRDAGALFIADEIQTGFCRTGSWFACSHESVVPDLVATAKGIAAGMPLAAVTGRAEIMDSIHEGGLGGTYGGNPVAAAAALAAIEVMRRDDLAGRARWIEQFARPRLTALAGSCAAIGEVRGRGAMLALEFVMPGTTVPNPAAVKAVLAACHAEGVVAISCGTYGNVVRLLPPLSIPEPLLDDGLSVLESAVHSLADD